VQKYFSGSPLKRKKKKPHILCERLSTINVICDALVPSNGYKAFIPAVDKETQGHFGQVLYTRENRIIY